MGLFGKKKTEAAPMKGPAAGTPTDIVIQMRQQRLSNNQIVTSLQKEGYSSSQIFDAMSQADIKGIVEAAPGGIPSGQPGQMPMQTGQMPMPALGEMPPPPGMAPPAEQITAPAPMPPGPMPAPQMPPMQAQIPTTGRREEIEEVAEGIIDEKWDELMKSVDKIITWKETTETKMDKIEQEIKDMKNSFEELHKGILAKVGEYDQNIKTVGIEIKAMEQVFKKTLPTFTQNINELSRLTKKLKK